MWFLFHFRRRESKLINAIESLHVSVVIISVISLCIAEIKSSTETCDMSCGTSNALVLYDESKLSPLVKPSRSFHFVNTDLVIAQDWGKHGVAAVVWDAAIVLCEYMEKIKEEFDGREVIELGAGSGLVGIVAALLGANVVITDRETVFPYMRKVVKESLKDKDNVKYSVKVLDWTRDLHKFQQKFDVILGADIIYVEEIFDALLETLLHLSHKGTKLYLSCKIRYDRDTKFLDMMREHFTLREILHEKDRDIKIFLCQKIK